MREGRPSSTAANIAAARAWLTREGLLDDPYAERFVTGSRGWTAKAVLGPLARINRRAFAYLAARTRFYDRLVEQGLDAGATQVVLVAAGYDCRAWRFAREGVRFFEVDHPDTQTNKRRLLDGDAGAGPTYVPADLAEMPLDGALFPAGFNPAQATVFCCEGLTMYLSEPAVAELLGTAARIAAPGSCLGVDFALQRDGDNPPDLVTRMARAAARMHGERLTFITYPDDAEDLITRSGWGIDEILVARELQQRYLDDGELDTAARWNGSFVASATVRH